MSIRISVNITDRDECRAALDHIFYAHPGLSKEIQDGDGTPVFTSTRATGSDAATDPKIGVETDSRGVPWIDGVHATTKSKKQDGTWTKKRGVDDAEVEAAEKAALAELDATPEPVVPEDEVPAEGPTTALPPSGTTGMPGMPGAAPAPVAGLPGAENMPGVAPAPEPQPPVSWQELVDMYTMQANAGKVDAPTCEAYYETVGTDIKDMQTNETARRQVYDWLASL